ncbi:hypothetical protein PAMP_007088 [Pampus punctatissimus]
MRTQLVGICLAIIGLLGTILICGLPMWKVTAFVGANIITAQVFWEGLWMNCVIQSTGHSQCKAYDSVLALPQELQASRALICVSIAVSVVAIGLTVVGARCTNFYRDDWRAKSNIGVSGGVVFIIAGLLCIIPVSWSAHSIITGFYNPLATNERRGELGASIYMGGQGRQLGGLTLGMMGILGVCVTCGLPMWRETDFVGANIVTAQSVWDGLWLHCVVQSTGQMQCKRHTSTSITMTPDIQAGRALTLISIVAGLLGFIVSLLGGGVANCSGASPDPSEPPSTSSTRKKACLLGGALCVLSGILCLVSVSWSAAATISNNNDPLVVAALKREVGSSIYIGWASSVLLLLGGALICFICGEKESSQPAYSSYMPYSSNSQFSDYSSRMSTLRSDVMRSNSSRMFDPYAPNRMLEHVVQVYDPLNKA